MLKKLSFLLCLFTSCVFAQLVNGSFEDTIIDSNPFDTMSDERPVGWTFYATTGTELTDEAYDGNKAVKIWSWYFGQANTELIYGEHNPNFGDTISTFITRLKGFYKFTDVVSVNGISDSAYVELTITKFNSSSSQRDTLAFVTKNLPPTDTYTNFEIPITYQNSIVSDSLFLKFRSSFLQGTGSSVDENNYLYLDKLELETSHLSLKDFTKNDIKIYPNPIDDILIITVLESAYEINFYSIEGKLIIYKILTVGENKIDVSGIANGTYFFKLTRNHFSKIFKVIKR